MYTNVCTHVPRNKIPMSCVVNDCTSREYIRQTSTVRVHVQTGTGMGSETVCGGDFSFRLSQNMQPREATDSQAQLLIRIQIVARWKQWSGLTLV